MQMRKLKPKENLYEFLVSRTTSGITRNIIKDIPLFSILSSVKKIFTSYFIFSFIFFSSFNPLVPFGNLPTVWAFHVNFFLQLFFCSFHCFLQLFISFCSLIDLETCSYSVFVMFSLEPKISWLLHYYTSKRRVWKCLQYTVYCENMSCQFQSLPCKTESQKSTRKSNLYFGDPTQAH